MGLIQLKKKERERTFLNNGPMFTFRETAKQRPCTTT